MKKIYIFTIGLLFVVNTLLAQTSNIVNKAIAEVPFDTQEQYYEAMESLLAINQEAVPILVMMMGSSTSGENSKMEYVLSGLTKYTAGLWDREKDRLSLSNTYLNALELTSERETLAFILRQLELVGGYEAVKKVSPFVADEALSGPATRTLAQIAKEGGMAKEDAEEALLHTLANTNSNVVKREIISALGFMKAENAESAVLKHIDTQDIPLEKAVYNTLGKIGSETSLKKMYGLAKNVDFRFDHTDITASYLNLIKTIAQKGNWEVAKKTANDLVSDAKKSNAQATRMAALTLLMDIDPTSSTALVLDALKDSSSQYRLSALRAASTHHHDEALYREVVKVFIKEKDDNVKIDIATWAEEQAQNKDNRKLMQFLAKPLAEQIDTENIRLQQGIAKALVQLGNEESIAPLTAMVVRGKEPSMTIAKNALASFDGNITNLLGKNLLLANDTAKVAILDLLALRKSSSHLGEVISLTNTGANDVRRKAYATLKDLVESKDIISMYSLLDSDHEPGAATAIQEAMIASLKLMPKETQYDEIAEKISKTKKDKQYLYYTALATTNDSRALAIIMEGYNSKDKAQKDAAFDALLTLQSLAATDELIKICKKPMAEEYFDRSMDRYISLVSNLETDTEKRFAYLTDAMNVARTDSQRNAILRAIRHTNSYESMVYAGSFLDDKGIQESAAQAVMQIAVKNKNFDDETTHQLLYKVIGVLNNADSAYQIEAVKKHLSEIGK